MLYETEADRTEEQKMRSYLNLLGFRVELTETRCAYDCLIYCRGGLVAVGEFKKRDKLWNPLNVDQSKIDGLLREAESRNCRAVFIVGSGDSGYWFVEPHYEYPVKMFQRKRGADARKDREVPVYQIPKEDFSSEFKA